MKFDRDFLKTGKVETISVPEQQHQQQPLIVSEDIPPESLRSKFRFEYDPNLICPTQLAEKNSMYDAAVEYCKSFGVKVAQHLAEAMAERAGGERILSPREADIVTRGKFTLDNDFFWKSMEMSQGYIQEGEINFRLNPWEIRSRYNKGLHWKNTAREKSSAAQKLKGDTILSDLRLTLIAYKLPPYPAEGSLGFSRELCKPEFLSWEQYDAIRSQFKMGTEEHQKELLT